jgi:uncharacterized membrane protein
LADLFESGIVSGTMIQNSAVLRADAAGKLHVFVTTDRSGRKGAAIGGLAGGIVGLLGPAVVSPRSLVAIASGLANELRYAGFPDTRLDHVRARVQPACSILVTAVTEVNDVAAVLRSVRATVVCEPIEDRLLNVLTMAARSLTQSLHSGQESVAAGLPEPEPGGSGSSPSRTPRTHRVRTTGLRSYDHASAHRYVRPAS